MKVSYVIVTHNRRERLLRTLGILRDTTPLPREQWEAWVVDNASTDGTIEAVRQRFPEAHVLARPSNEGVWARSLAFEKAAGDYIVLLDDDSYPVDDAVARSIAYLDATPGCAAVVGRVILPDGSLEACAMPAVMLSGAVCIRKSVLSALGGFRREFFRKAGEYDLSFRIWQAGHRIDRFEDIVYCHDKVTAGRSAAFAHRMDLRNNLILVERYLPADLRPIYWADFAQRYSAIAQHVRHGKAARQALWEARLWSLREMLTGRQTLNARTVEAIFDLERQRNRIGAWARQNNIKRVVIGDFSKNLYATYSGCIEAGLRVVAIADDNPAFMCLSYRGVPVVPTAPAFAAAADGAVLSNINPAQVDRGMDRLRAAFDGPILRLWEPVFLRQKAVAA